MGFESDGGVLELNREGLGRRLEESVKVAFVYGVVSPKGSVCVKLGQKAQVCSIDFGLI